MKKKQLNRREFMAAAGVLAAAGTLATAGMPMLAQAQEQAICYNCPPEWADWGGMLRLIGQRLNIAVPPDNKNSGQTLAALIAERASPVADIAYFGGQFGPKARDAGVLTPFKPTRFADIPAGLKDPDGYWYTIHSGTLGLFVNTAALRGRPVPQAWADLLRPDYRGMVGYLNPAAAAVGQLGVIAVNFALGGTYDNLDPGIDFFRRLRANAPIVPMQTAYARVLSGEIPILFDFDFNAYRAKHRDNAPTTFVIPQEGTRQLPYIVGLVAGGPNPAQGRRILDFLLSDEGQRHWAGAFMRPVFAAAMTSEIKARFLPDTEYARARMVDVFRLAAASTAIAERYRRDLG